MPPSDFECDLGPCNDECLIRCGEAERSGTNRKHWINWIKGEHTSSKATCNECGNENVMLSDEPWIRHLSDGTIELHESYMCDECLEPQFDEVTIFTCPRVSQKVEV